MHSKEIRERALLSLARGDSLSRASLLTGASRSTIRRWAEDPTIVERGDCPLPVRSGAAYAALLGYYLGDGCISRNGRTYSLRISCDARLPKILDDCEAVVAAVHPERRTYRVPGPGTVAVQSYWKHWPCLFPQHGPGRKHTWKLVLEPWQRDIVEAYPADFLRGLFHSDGCLVKNWATRTVAGETKRYDYPRWQFVNESADIMQWCGQALDLLGIRYRQTSRRVLSVSRRDDVARLTELIGVKS